MKQITINERRIWSGPCVDDVLAAVKETLRAVDSGAEPSVQDVEQSVTFEGEVLYEGGENECIFVYEACKRLLKSTSQEGHLKRNVLSTESLYSESEIGTVLNGMGYPAPVALSRLKELR